MDTTQTSNPISNLEERQYAGFIKRAIAVLIDSLVIGNVGRMVGRMIFSPEDIKLAVFSALIGWIYYALMESSKYQGTIGKMFMKIKVTNLEGNRINFINASIRHFSKFLSTITLGIGFLMVLWTDRKQALHDIIAKTLVVNK